MMVWYPCVGAWKEAQLLFYFCQQRRLFGYALAAGKTKQVKGWVILTLCDIFGYATRVCELGVNVVLV